MLNAVSGWGRQGLQIIPGIAAFFFDDDKTLGHEADALLEEGDSPREPLLNGYPRPGVSHPPCVFLFRTVQGCVLFRLCILIQDCSGVHSIFLSCSHIQDFSTVFSIPLLWFHLGLI
jgi:hypothetical protein